MELDELKRLEREATPGPWHISGYSDGPGRYHLHVGAKTSLMSLASMNHVHTKAKPNAALIAAARNALPALIECAEALESLMSPATLEDSQWHFAARKAAAAALAALKEAGK